MSMYISAISVFQFPTDAAPVSLETISTICSKGTTDKLEKISKQSIRFVFRDKHIKYEELLRQLCLLIHQNQRLGRVIRSVFI